MNNAEKVALNTIAVAGDSWITAETPVKTGQLRSSNQSRVNEKEKSVVFGNDAEHAIFVHEGTIKNPNKQPFIRRPIESRGNDLQSLAEKAFKGAFK